MTIEITEKIVGIWFIDLDDDSDWLGAAERTDEGHKLTYRFRYYVDDKAHDSEDKKSWYGGTVAGKDDDEIIDDMRSAVHLLARVAGDAPTSEILMGNKTLKEFMDEFMELPQTHSEKIDTVH